jgi:hypothetical protein
MEKEEGDAGEGGGGSSSSPSDGCGGGDLITTQFARGVTGSEEQNPKVDHLIEEEEDLSQQSNVHPG